MSTQLTLRPDGSGGGQDQGRRLPSLGDLSDNAELRGAIGVINSGVFSHGDTELFRPLTNSLLQQDPRLVFADDQPYRDCQAAVDDASRDRGRWARMSILNAARIGKFSSDRSIREFCAKIWQVSPMTVQR